MNKKLNLLNDVTSKLIMCIDNKNNYLAKIKKKIQSTDSHMVRVLYTLEEEKIIIKNKVGRKCYIYLTPKGKEIQKYLLKIKNLI